VLAVYMQPHDPDRVLVCLPAACGPLRLAVPVIIRGLVARGLLGRRRGFRLSLQFCLGLAKLGEPSLFVGDPRASRHRADPLHKLIFRNVRRLGLFEPRLLRLAVQPPVPSCTRTHGLMLGGIRLDLSAVERNVPKLHQPGPRAQL
jgi:hypothetical protein